MQKSLKRLKKDEEEKKKKVVNEAASVSTSLAHRGEPRPYVLPIPTLISEGVGVLSTPSTIEVTIVVAKDSKPSHDLPES